MVRTAKHTLKHTIEIIAGLSAVLILGCGLLAWQLSKGDIPLGAFSSFVQAGINAGLDELTIEVDETVLRWSQEERSLHVRIIGVDFHDIEGTHIGNVSEVHVWVGRAWGWQSPEDARKNRDIVNVQERPKEAQPVPCGPAVRCWTRSALTGPVD